MKTKLIAALVALWLMSIVTSAQGYSIRVAFNTNLRAAASMQARIVETAPAGTDLNVIGEADRWLQINRNGATVWMASWVRHERIEDSQQTGAEQQVSNVDNCCFVDRQCTSDQEWTDGYWAFRNGQCTAPTQTQTQTSTPITTTVSSETDNCCFVDRQCNSDQEWTDGYWAFQNGQCGAPAQSQVQTSSQPATTDPSSVNNCCFLDWQCNTDAEWTAGFHAYQNNQCHSPSQSTVIGDPSQVDNCCFAGWQCNSDDDYRRGYLAREVNLCHVTSPDTALAINGSPAFVGRIKEALRLLWNREPKWWQYVTSGLSTIIEVPTGSVLGVYVETRTYQVATDHALAGGYGDEPVVELAAGMAHEACHVHRWEAGYREVAWREEKACLGTEIIVSAALDIHDHYDHQWLQDFYDNIENPAYWWWADD